MRCGSFCINSSANAKFPDRSAARTIVESALQAGRTALTDPEAREIIYGMPFAEWQATNQREATPEQKVAFDASKPKH